MSNKIQKSRGSSIQNGQSHFQFAENHSFDSKDTTDSILSPQRIIALLLGYKWFILLCLVAGVVGAWIYADSLTPIYESKGTLLISTDASANDELSQIISQTTGYGISSTIENEVQVLRSRKFSRQVAEALIKKDLKGVVRFPILWTITEEGDIHQSEGETVASRIMSNLLILRPAQESDVIEISFQSPSAEEAAMIVNLVMDIYVENSTRQNRQAAESTARFLEKEKREVKQRLEDSEEKLRKFMDNTGIVQVNDQASGIVTQRATIKAELQNVNLELESIEQAIADYESRLDRIKPGLTEQFSEAIGPRIENAQQELAGYENERTLIIAKNPEVLQRNPIPDRLKFVNDQINRLKGEIKELTNQLFTENNEFLGLDSQDRVNMISNIQSSLVDLRISKKQNQSRRDALLKLSKQMETSFNALPKGIVELAKLQREVTLNEELWLNVSRQYADISILKQSQFGFGRIIDQGEIPENPVSPNKKILLILGLMAGSVLSAGFIFVKESMDNTVKNVEDIGSKILPDLSLSVIPTFEEVPQKHRKSFTVGKGEIPDEMVLLYNTWSIASESIRRLKNNIIFQHGDTHPKTVAITSPEKGDGKSTIVANLGIAFAEDGYKTLVIGADFRRPKLSKYFGLKETNGLSDYLNGKLSFQELLMLIQNTEVNYLKVLTAGSVPPNPEVIGGSKLFQQFLKQMEQTFDVIILDTPPFGIISDSAALLKVAEVTLVVAKHRKTNQGMFLRTVEELRRIKANVTGIVLNEFDYRKETGHYYSTGYYQTLYSNYEVYTE